MEEREWSRRDRRRGRTGEPGTRGLDGLGRGRGARHRATRPVAAALLCGLLGLLLASCGGPATASPEHLGTWQSSNGGVDVTIVVTGEAGHYTADFDTSSKEVGEVPTIHFSGGQADAAGNVTFEKDHVTGWGLTLGPVSGDGSGATMTAYIMKEGFPTEMTRD